MSFGAKCMINCAAVAHKLDLNVPNRHANEASIMLRDTVLHTAKQAELQHLVSASSMWWWWWRRRLWWWCGDKGAKHQACCLTTQNVHAVADALYNMAQVTHADAAPGCQ